MPTYKPGRNKKNKVKFQTRKSNRETNLSNHNSKKSPHLQAPRAAEGGIIKDRNPPRPTVLLNQATPKPAAPVPPTQVAPATIITTGVTKPGSPVSPSIRKLPNPQTRRSRQTYHLRKNVPLASQAVRRRNNPPRTQLVRRQKKTPLPARNNQTTVSILQTQWCPHHPQITVPPTRETAPL